MSDNRMPTIFVDAESGDDQNDGSESAPVRTKERADKLACGIAQGKRIFPVVYARHTDDTTEWVEQSE